MVSRVQHTIKTKFYSGIKCDSQSQQSNFRKLQKKEDESNKVYDSDGEPGPFCGTGDLEDTQYFDEYALPVSTPPDDIKHFYDYEGNESVAEV